MSYYDYEDFYGELSEFEQQIDEFKNSLLGVVKEEYINKMDQLKKKMKSYRKSSTTLKISNVNMIKRPESLKLKKRNCMSIVRKERLSN